MKYFVYFACVCLIPGILQGYMPMPQEQRCSDDEIAWFGKAGAHLVFCWGDGVITAWDLDAKAGSSTLKLDNYSFQFTTLNISSNQSKPVLAAFDMAGTGSLKFYNVVTGKIIRKLAETNYIDIRFLKSAEYVFWATKGGIFKVGLDKGEKAWIVKYGEKVSTGLEATTLFPEKQTYVLFYEDWLIAKDFQDRLVWKKKVDMGEDYYEPYCVAGRDGLVVSSTHISTMAHRYLGINIADGRIIWRTRKPYGSLLDVSDDLKQQVWYEKRKIKVIVTFLPDDKLIEIPKVNTQVEGVFSSDGKSLIYLPALQIQEEKEDYIKYGRSSHVLTIVNLSNVDDQVKYEIHKNGLKPVNQTQKISPPIKNPSRITETKKPQGPAGNSTTDNDRSDK